ncbi:MAG: thiamine phosphate synthase, partial [Chloroflexi bacterium]|nr:thiamine phosphate synthase [Chloroflexota bacterium]
FFIPPSFFAPGFVTLIAADVAAAVGATAVHLGREDLPPYVAREILGPGAIIGGTANSVEEAVKVAKQPVDYLGVGPVFGTTSKGNRAAPMLGLERFGEICEAVDKPVIGIGSISADRVADVLSAGAYGVAVLSAVVCQDDPQASCRAFADEIERALT